MEEFIILASTKHHDYGICGIKIFIRAARRLKTSVATSDRLHVVLIFETPDLLLVLTTTLRVDQSYYSLTLL